MELGMYSYMKTVWNRRTYLARDGPVYSSGTRLCDLEPPLEMITGPFLWYSYYYWSLSLLSSFRLAVLKKCLSKICFVYLICHPSYAKRSSYTDPNFNSETQTLSGLSASVFAAILEIISFFLVVCCFTFRLGQSKLSPSRFCCTWVR
jgi:hypothetical protein